MGIVRWPCSVTRMGASSADGRGHRFAVHSLHPVRCARPCPPAPGAVVLRVKPAQWRGRRSFQESGVLVGDRLTTGCCPGYVIDHIKRVKEGGADEPWRTGKDAKANDGWE
jgi:hypothetical protein